MGQVAPKYFLPSAPYGSSEASNALNPVQPAAVNPQMPLLPTNFQDPGTMTKTQSSPAKLGGNQNVSNGNDFGKLFKGLFGAVLFLFLVLPSFATTSVTGHLSNLGTGNITSSAFVRFWLRGCSGNQPTISGTALIAPTQGSVFYFDLIADASGNISGTLYSTRDSTGNSGGDISCGGSATAVWYGMQIFVAGKSGPEVPIHAKNGVVLNITSVTPISTTPVVAAPTGDNTYIRLDGGNSPVTGAITWNATQTYNGNETHAGTETHGGTETHNGAATFTNGVTANNIFDSNLTTGNCVQAASSGQLTTVSGPCGTSSGTITATGSPASPNMTCFSGATSITNCNLSGDATTSGNSTVTVVKINGNSVPAGAAAHQALIGTATSTLSLKTIPDCQDSSGNHLNYTQSSDSFGCGTSVSSLKISAGHLGSTSCTTGSSSYNQCTSDITISPTMPDTNYYPFCMGKTPSDPRGAITAALVVSTSVIRCTVTTEGSNSVSYADIFAFGVHP